MTRFLALLLFLTVFLSCNNSAEVKLDVDSVGRKFNEKAEKSWDSTKEGLKKLKNKVEDRLDRKDSIDRK
jgi:hypothetical protein